MTQAIITELFRQIKVNMPVGCDDDQAFKESLLAVTELLVSCVCANTDSLERMATAMESQTKVLCHAYNIQADEAETAAQA